MIIYCTGDSYTEGSELGDELLPEWPGYITKAEVGKLGHPWYRKKLNKYIEQASPELLVERQQLMVERAWPFQLGRQLNATEINAGAGGFAINNMLTRAMLDLDNFQSMDIKVDKFFLMITSIPRLSIFTAEDKNVNHNNVSTTLLPHLIEFEEDQAKVAMMKAWVNVEGPYSQCVRYLLDLAMLNEYVYSKL